MLARQGFCTIVLHSKCTCTLFATWLHPVCDQGVASSIQTAEYHDHAATNFWPNHFQLSGQPDAKTTEAFILQLEEESIHLTNNLYHNNSVVIMIIEIIMCIQ